MAGSIHAILEQNDGGDIYVSSLLKGGQLAKKVRPLVHTPFGPTAHLWFAPSSLHPRRSALSRLTQMFRSLRSRHASLPCPRSHCSPELTTWLTLPTPHLFLARLRDRTVWRR